jgi:hypothetical protein
MIPLSIGSWWSTFPWQSVGGVGVVVGFIIGALKVAAMIGAQKQVGVDHDRRILALEGKADGVPEEVTHEVTNRNKFLEGSVRGLTHKLSQLYKAARQLKLLFDQLHKRCQDEHGEFEKLAPDEIDNVLATPPDTDETGGSDAAQG